MPTTAAFFYALDTIVVDLPGFQRPIRRVVTVYVAMSLMSIHGRFVGKAPATFRPGSSSALNTATQAIPRKTR